MRPRVCPGGSPASWMGSIRQTVRRRCRGILQCVWPASAPASLRRAGRRPPVAVGPVLPRSPGPPGRLQGPSPRGESRPETAPSGPRRRARTERQSGIQWPPAGLSIVLLVCTPGVPAGHSRLLEGRHFGQARRGRLDQTHRQHRAGSLAEPHAQVQEGPQAHV